MAVDFKKAGTKQISMGKLISLQGDIVEAFESLVMRGPSKRRAEELGELVRFYRDFHVATDEMLPDRAIDVSETCESIGRLLGEMRVDFAHGYQSMQVNFSEDASEIPAMPFLSSLTVARLEDAPYAHEAATFARFPSRR